MKRVDFDVSVAVGLGISIPLYMLSTLPEMCGSRDPLTLGDGVVMLVAFGSYLAVPPLLRLLPGRRPARLRWLWTPVLGSLLLTVAHYSWRTLSAEWAVEKSAVVWLSLCLWTLPFAAAAHYCGVFASRRRRRRARPNEDTGILER